MDPIASFSGLASGIQWQDMIDQIMKLEAARSVDPLKTRYGKQNARIDAWKTYEGLVSKLRSASISLRDGSSFGIYKSTAGLSPAGRALISATASTTATPGNYRVEVIELAKAEKLNGRIESSTTTALGLGGQFFINGRNVDLAATDTLSDVRDKINAVNSGASASGVTATILSTGTDSHRLILTADQTGSRGVELVDSASSGGVLQQLGITDGILAANTSLTDSSRTESQRFTSSATQLASMLGVSPAPAQTSIKIDGQKIEVDLANDTLIDIMNRVVAAGGAASLVQETVGGRTQVRLSVGGTVEADTDVGVDAAASQRVVELLGFQRSGHASEITAGSDAVASIDGFRVTRRSNVISDAIAGVTINLLAAETTGRTSSTTGGALAVTVDPMTISAGTYAVNFEATTSRLASILGASLAITSQTGVDSGAIADGSYAIDFTSTIDRTTSADPNLTITSAPGSVAAGVYAVEATVTRSQSSTNGSLSATTAGTSVAAGDYAVSLTTTRSTSASPNLAVTSAGSSVAAGTYAVNITQAARQATATGSTALASTYTTGDTVTILDNVTGKSATITLTNGETLADVTNKMNTAFIANGMEMTATDDGTGKLKLVGDDFGSAASFKVTTSHNRVTTGLGLGATVTGTTYTGQNVAGTIGGIAASGTGQTLTGSGALSGLVVNYTGTTTGAVGNVTITDTVTAGTINGAAATWNAGSGTLTSATGLVLTYAGAAPAGSLAGPTTASVGTVTLTDQITGGTLGGVAAAWDAGTSTFTSPDGLAVQYSGAVPTGSLATATTVALGNATVTDFEEITGGTIGGQAATWDALTQTLTANAGTTLEGLSIAYSGAATSGVVGSVEVDSTTTLDGVTIGGEAADWDPVTGNIRGRTGSRFDALEMSYSGPASYAGTTQPGHVGDLVIAGDVSVDLTISRDTGGTVAAIQAYADAYNGIRDFLATQQSSGDVLATNGTLRSTARSLTEVMLTDIASLAGTGFSRATSAGVSLDRDGKLTVDSATLTSVLQSSPNDVKSLFGEIGDAMYEASDAIAASFSGTVASQIRFLEESNAALDLRIDDVEARLEVRRQSLIRQYTQMESMISQIQSQGNWLSQQISSMQPKQS
jgi:flagellar hook-associated protein 2